MKPALNLKASSQNFYQTKSYSSSRNIYLGYYEVHSEDNYMNEKKKKFLIAFNFFFLFIKKINDWNVLDFQSEMT